MMYRFEFGLWPKVSKEEDREFSTDQEAWDYARKIGADYAFDLPEDRNPSGLWRKCNSCDGTGEIHSHNPSCMDCGGSGDVNRGKLIMTGAR